MNTTQIITERGVLALAIREGADYGTLNVRSTAEHVREFYCVGDEIADEEIEATLAETLRSEIGPILVLTRGDFRVLVLVDIGCEGEIAEAKGIRDAARILSGIDGTATNTLSRVSAAEGREGGDDILRAYRMPEGDYYGTETDARLVERYGFEIGRYRIGEEPTGDRALREQLAAALEGQPYEELTVEDGTCTVAFFDAPGAPDGWAVGLSASEGHLVATFERDGASSEEVAYEPAEPEARERAFRCFLRDPAAVSADAWEIVETRRQDAAAA